MSKQKIVIRVPMNNKKLRNKAMAIAIGVSENIQEWNATIKGDNKDQIEVTGEEIDSVRLASLLRKKFGYADFVSICPVGKTEEKKDKEKVEPIVAWPYVYSSVPHYPVYEIKNEPSCSIM